MKQKLKNKMMSFLKRAFLAVAVLMTAMGIGTSCSKDMNPVGMGNGQAIGFSVYTAKPVTKGATFDLPYLFGYWDENSSTYVPGTGIGVFAFYQKAKSNGYAVDFNKYTGEPTYMYNQKVERTSSDGLNYCFNYSPVKYWPNNANDQISFFAYGPYDETFAWEDLQLETNLKGTKVTRDYVVEENIEDMTDYIWADPVMNKKNTDVGGAVQFDFIHLCSRLSVSTKVNVKASSIYVTVDKVTITGNFMTSGTLVYLPADETHHWENLDGFEETKTYTPFEASYTYDPESGEPVLNTFVVDTIKQVIPDNSGYIFVLPGIQDIHLNAKVSQRSSTTDWVMTYDIEQDFPAMQLQENKAYNFLLNITLNPVTFSGSVVTWEATTETYTSYDNGQSWH